MFLTMGGGFVLSDDSHSVEQVGLNYDRVFEAVKKAGITRLFYCRPVDKAEGRSAEYIHVEVSTLDY